MGGYQEVMKVPIDDVLDYFDFIIFKNNIENFSDE